MVRDVAMTPVVQSRSVDQGQTDLEQLSRQLADTGHKAWVRVVGGPPAEPTPILFALVIVGPESDEWTSTVWQYEQCIFASGVMSAGEFASLLKPGPRSVTLGVVTFQLDLAPNQFGWQRKPSRALYDQCQFDWPSEIHTPSLASQGGANAPQGYLVGAGETHSFPVFSAAFGAYFYNDFSVSGTQNPLLGQLSIRVLDDRGRIDGVDPTDGGVQVLLDGTGLVGTVLEFNSATHHEVQQIAGPGPTIISVDPHEVPPDAWIWLKSGRQWLDFRNLQRWGASLSSDVRLPADDIGESVALAQAASGDPTDLYGRAAAYAHKTIVAYVEGEHHDFFLFAGVAVELAVKNRLAVECPTFLASSKKFESSLELWRTRHDLRTLPSGVPTVAGAEAVDRLTMAEPALAAVKSQAYELLGYRNGEAHLGISDPTLRTRAFVSFLEVVTAVLPVNDDSFWHPHDQLVRVTLDQNAARVHQVVELKLSTAKQHFLASFGGLEQNVRDVVIRVVSGRAMPLEENQASIDCPACGSRAVATGTNTVEVGDPDFGSDGQVEGTNSWLEFVAFSLDCPACGLHLDNPLELTAASVPTSWPHRDADVLNALFERDAILAEYADYDPDDGYQDTET
jgi:hypothetical protein